MSDLPRETVELIAQDPRKYLRRCYRLSSRIRVKDERIEQLYQVTQRITTSVKAVSAYTGPSDKIGNCVLKIVELQEEIREDIGAMLSAQKEVERTIRDFVPDTVQRSILEARYVTNMSWEQIAYEFHYAYRWTMRLHQRALAAMKEEATRRLSEWANEE